MDATPDTNPHTNPDTNPDTNHDTAQGTPVGAEQSADDAPEQLASPPRLSMMALGALACSLLALLLGVVSVVGVSLGFGGVLVAVLLMPPLAFTGASAGYMSLSRIRRNPQLTGRAPALVGLFVGMMTAVLASAFAAGAMIALSSYTNTLAPAATTALTAASRGNTEAAVEFISQSTDTTDNQRALARMISAFEAKHGTFTQARFSMNTFVDARAIARQRGSAAGGKFPLESPPKPLELIGANSSALAYFMMDDVALQKDEVRAMDILIILDQQAGTGITFRKDGPASVVAKALGLEVTAAVGNAE